MGEWKYNLYAVSIGTIWKKLLCFMQDMLYCPPSETALDSNCVRNCAALIAHVDTVERREISGNLFSCFSRLYAVYYIDCSRNAFG
jgi:hypothetical protein